MINHSRRHFFISQTALYGSAAVSLTLEESPSFFDGLRNINKSSANYSRVEQLAARQSHKLKAAGSSPAPATIFASALCFNYHNECASVLGRAFFYSDVPLMLPGAGHAGLFSVSSFFWHLG
jgi:hypothetical protein